MGETIEAVHCDRCGSLIVAGEIVVYQGSEFHAACSLEVLAEQNNRFEFAR